MIDQFFRARLPRVVQPITNALTKFGVTPNQLTIVGFVIALGAGVAVANELPMLALILWWTSRLVDGLDGILARHLGVASLLAATSILF